MSDPKLTEISGIGPATARVLAENGFADVETVSKASAEDLAKVSGFGNVRAARIIKTAQSLLFASPTPVLDSGSEKVKKKRRDKKKRKDKKKKKDKGKKKGKKGKKRKRDGKKKRKK